MPYLTAYLTGLDLNTSFPSAGECIGNSFGFIDKTVQFQNNLSLTLNYTKVEDVRLAYPVLNFTGMIANYLANIPVDCFNFWRQFQFYWENLFFKMGNSVTVFLQAYLLSQMSNAKKYRDSIRVIQKNGEKGTQNYIAVFEQYGVISNLLLYTTKPYRESFGDYAEWAESIAGFDTFTGVFN